MKTIIKCAASATLVLLFQISSVFPISAHAGKTDINGGHTDHETGEYHYHHGYPAHSHYDMDDDGIIDCPYEFDDKTGQNSGTSNGGGPTGNSHKDDSTTPTITTRPTTPNIPSNESVPPTTKSTSSATSATKAIKPSTSSSRLKPDSHQKDLEDYLFTWQYLIIGLCSAAIAVSLFFLSSHLESKGHHRSYKLCMIVTIVSGIIALPLALVIVAILYFAYILIFGVGYIIISIGEFVSSFVKHFKSKRRRNKTHKRMHLLDKPIKPQSSAPEPINDTPPSEPSKQKHSNDTPAYLVSDFIWTRSIIFSKQIDKDSPLRARTYLWTSFFYAVVKTIRNQTIVDEIYSQFLAPTPRFIEKDDEINGTLKCVQSDYRTFREILNASEIDPRTSDGVEKLWTLTSERAFPDIDVPSNALSGFRYNINLLTNHALTKYKIKKPSETVYMVEAKNGMTVRVPESKLQTWTAAQKGTAPQMTEEQRKALAERIVHHIYHPDDK